MFERKINRTISNKTGLQSVSRPVEIVHYSKGWSKSLEYLIRIIFAIFYIAHMLRMVRATLILPVISEVPVELGIWHSCITRYNVFRFILNQECQEDDQLGTIPELFHILSLKSKTSLQMLQPWCSGYKLVFCCSFKKNNLNLNVGV